MREAENRFRCMAPGRSFRGVAEVRDYDTQSRSGHGSGTDLRLSVYILYIYITSSASLDSEITHELRSHRHLYELLNSKITQHLYITQTQSDHT